MFELTVPAAHNIDARHIEKSNKYAHFLTDMSDNYHCSVTAFEVGNLGFISTRNHNSLYSLHKYLKPGLKLKRFKENISALAVYSSYYVFITRKEQLFCEPPHLNPPFVDQ